VQPGKYRLTVASEGFAEAVREGIEVRVAEKLTLDVQVQVSGVGDTVTVSAGLTSCSTARAATTRARLRSRSCLSSICPKTPCAPSSN
jgi:hypothetical protein